MKSEEDIVIREVSKDDILPLAHLYERVWPGHFDFHLAKTKWAINYSAYNGVLAEYRGKVIGSRTCFLTNIHFGELSLRCVQLGDSCIDRDYRRLGLFTRMNKVFIDDFFCSKNELVYNVSVEASKFAYQKLDWVYIDSLRALYYISRPFHVLRATRGDIRKLTGNITTSYSPIPDISSISDELLRLREEFVMKNRIHTKYDRETLLWRIEVDSGIRLFQIDGLGACVYKVGAKGNLKWLQLGEIFLYDYSQGSFNKLINIVQKELSPDIMEACITVGHPLYLFYRRKFFLGNPKKPFLNLGVKVISEKMKSLCLEPNNWALSFLDIDTF